MPAELTTLSTQEIATLIEKDERQHLRTLLNDMHPADLAQSLSQMDRAWKLYCFRLLDLDSAGAALAELPSSEQKELLKELGDLSIVPIISRMQPDEAVNLLSALTTQKARSIISQMTDLDTAEDLQELMSFKENTAGRIMSPNYLAVKEYMTVEDTLKLLKAEYDNFEEDLYDVYVVNEDNQLEGRLTVKELLTAEGRDRVSKIMEAGIVATTTDVDQEKAADLLKRYHLLSLPVVDFKNKLRGIITADDVIDVIEEEASEDLFQSSGISATRTNSERRLFQGDVRVAFRARLPWLAFVLFVETISAMVIGHFDEVIRQTVVAAAFMPLLSAVTGSAAVQSTCIAIRAASYGSLTDKAVIGSLLHELSVGALLGIACGVITFAIGLILKSYSPMLGLIVGISLFITMIIGVLTGTITPWLFQKAGIDPTYASGPLISSLLDVFTFTTYLMIVHTFLAQIVSTM